MPCKAMPDPARRLIRTCGLIGLTGCASVVASDIIAWSLVENYSPISQTISDLAAGASSWLLDLGLYLFAAAWFAVAVGSWAWRLAGLSWRIAAASAALLGLDILIIASFNQYAGQENLGANVHLKAVYALGVLFALACLLASLGLRKLSGSLGRSSLIVGIAWTILSPLFFFVPDAWNGAYERFLAVMLVTWLAALSWLLLQRSGGDYGPAPISGARQRPV